MAQVLRRPVTGSARSVAKSVPRWQMWSLREPLRSYVASVTVLAAGVSVTAVSRAHWQPSRALVYLALLACGVVAIESTRTIKEVHGAIVRDLQPVWYLAVAVILPPAYAL